MALLVMARAGYWPKPGFLGAELLLLVALMVLA
jgi:hypothetical protein